VPSQPARIETDARFETKPSEKILEARHGLTCGDEVDAVNGSAPRASSFRRAVSRQDKTEGPTKQFADGSRASRLSLC
jgi:hypothetical protein